MDTAEYYVRLVAFHECAHLSVAQHYGVPAQLSIWANQPADDDERPFCGSVRLTRPFSDHVGRKIGLAGVIGETLLGNDFVNALEMHDLLLNDITLSPGDAALAKAYSFRDIQVCLAIVRRNWANIVAAAEIHIAVIANVGNLRASTSGTPVRRIR